VPWRRFPVTEIPREERTPYFACTACGLIGEPDSADYTLTVDRGHVEWTRPMTVGCGFCPTQTRITSTDVLDRYTEHAGSRCGIRTACRVVDLEIRDHLAPQTRHILRVDPKVPRRYRGDPDDAPT
jgi:hypothetical protein